MKPEKKHKKKITGHTSMCYHGYISSLISGSLAKTQTYLLTKIIVIIRGGVLKIVINKSETLKLTFSKVDKMVTVYPNFPKL